MNDYYFFVALSHGNKTKTFDSLPYKDVCEPSNLPNVYKSAQNCLIVMQLCHDTKSNLQRKVIGENFAKYRCNKARVLSIIDKDTGNEVDSVKSNWDNSFIYEKNKIIHEPSYDMNHDVICTDGIHFFQQEKAALFFNKRPPPTNYTGSYNQWDDNGAAVLRSDYVNGIKNGIYELFYKWTHI